VGREPILEKLTALSPGNRINNLAAIRSPVPLYEYQCKSCHTLTERIQKFSDPPLTVCPHCGGEMEQLLSAPAVQFKGAGWYVTDYARKGSGGGSGGGSKEGNSGGDSDGKSSSGSGSSPSEGSGSSKGESSASKEKSSKENK
jgi:putative FmdB family regulatory protein